MVKLQFFLNLFSKQWFTAYFKKKNKLNRIKQAKGTTFEVWTYDKRLKYIYYYFVRFVNSY